MLTLFHHPFCPHSRFIRLAIGEYGLSMHPVEERVWERRQEFLVLNPACATPVLVEEGHHARELRRLTGLEVQENQARRLLNDIAAFGAAISREADADVPQAVVASRWLAEVYEPVTARVPSALRGRLEPAELFHELLEHRYYMSERAGSEVSVDEALRSYLDSVLTHRRDEQTVLRQA